MSVIPHLNSCNEHQWDFWADFLREHSEITIVAKEFQTGAALPKIAQWHIEHLHRIQEKIGRGLHVIAVAGRRHLRLLLRLEGFTVIDSVPFVRTHFRRRISRADGRWAVHFTPLGEPLDQLLQHNIEFYGAGIEESQIKCRQYLLPFDIEPVAQPSERIPAESTGQMSLWVSGVSLPGHRRRDGKIR